MVVKYKSEKYDNIRAIGFDASNELGFCVTMVQEVEAPKENPALNNKVIVLEGITVNALKISEV